MVAESTRKVKKGVTVRFSLSPSTAEAYNLRPMSNLAKILEDAAREVPERVCVLTSDGGRRAEHAYGAFARCVSLWASDLRRRAVRPGDRVAIVTPKCADQIRAMYAVWWAGAVAVPVCEALGKEELRFVLNDADPKLVLVHESLRERLVPMCGRLPLLAFSRLGDGSPAAAPPAGVEAGDLAALIYTSGSTGMPKGVALTHGNLFENVRSSFEVLPLGPGDRVLSLLPYWHSFALVAEVLLFVLCRGSVAIPRDKLDFVKNMGAYEPTVILAVPRVADSIRAGIRKAVAESPPACRAAFEKAMENAAVVCGNGAELRGSPEEREEHRRALDTVFAPLRSRFGGRLRFLIGGGAPVDEGVERFFRHIGIPLLQGYGLTESSPVISVNRPDRNRIGSSGLLIPWLTEARGGDYAFLAEDGRIGKGHPGELLVRGQCVMKGYWRREEETRVALRDGWLHTGDVGYLDRDGFLFLRGRRSNLICLRGGEKFHPEPVEERLKGIPMVREAVVIGEGLKSAYVLVNLEEEATASLPPEEVRPRLMAAITGAMEGFSPVQQIKDVLVLPDLSLEEGVQTATLKIRRHKVWEVHGDEIRAFLSKAGETLLSTGGRVEE